MRLTLVTPLMIAVAGCGSGTPDLATVKEQMSAEQLSLGEPVSNTVGMTFVPIPAGEFQMGTPVPEQAKADKKDPPKVEKSETPQHLVKISKPFYMSVCEVTQQQYAQVMGERPWEGQPLVYVGDHYAASYITWDKAAEFCETLSDQEGVVYRLPTEAEWEYACRAGTESTFSFGEDWKLLSQHAWYDQNAYKEGDQYAHRVGQKEPNAWAIYDMHGNVWEWCQDWYGEYDPRGEVVNDPAGPEQGWIHVWRGGSFAESPQNLRSASRLSFGRIDYRPEFASGFRVVREF